MNTTALALSLPLWKCGLKFKPLVATKLQYPVTSLVEVWIEIDSAGSLLDSSVVTSLVEVWIEI